jgi:hypothetical protein
MHTLIQQCWPIVGLPLTSLTKGSAPQLISPPGYGECDGGVNISTTTQLSWTTIPATIDVDIL